MVSPSFAIGDFGGGLYLSEARAASSGFTSEAIAVGSASDLSHPEHEEHLESEFRGEGGEQ